MEDHFKDVEEAFDRIKKQFRAEEISRREFIDRLKKLRLRDEQGRFWMIGAQSGKWYFFDGKSWVRADPPTLSQKKAICIYCGYENKLEAEVCVQCGEDLEEETVENRCPRCGRIMGKIGEVCASCQKLEERLREEESFPGEDEKSEIWLLRSVTPSSFSLFLGAVGVVVGILLGAIAGATDYFSGITGFVPRFFQETQGKLLGGIIFAGSGGIAGFLFFGFFGWTGALLINGILSFVGGLKITFKKRSDESREEADIKEDKLE